MRGLWIGLGLGMAIGSLVGFLARGHPDGPDNTHGATWSDAELPAVAREEPDVALRTATPGPSLMARGTEHSAEAFKSRAFILRVGESYTLGEQAICAAGTAEDDADIVCQDIRHGAVLRAPHGAAPIAMPIYIPTQRLMAPEPIFAAIRSAPMDLAQRDASLFPRPSRAATNMGFIQSKTGTVYKVRLVDVEGDPRVWKRRARFRYVVVPQEEDGGRVDFGPPPATSAISARTIEFLGRLGRSTAIPGDSFQSFLRPGSNGYQSMTGLPQEVELKKRLFVALPEPLRTRIKTTRNSGILATAGIAADGEIEVGSYTGVAVDGDMAGTIKVGSYAYIHITGDLVGTLDCGSYATVRIDGDVLGTLRVRSYVTLFLKGRFQTPATGLDCKGSCWSTFYLDGYRSEGELTEVPATGQITLHVRESDLGQGKHKLAPWREVIVGDKLWRVPR